MPQHATRPRHAGKAAPPPGCPPHHIRHHRPRSERVAWHARMHTPDRGKQSQDSYRYADDYRYRIGRRHRHPHTRPPLSLQVFPEKKRTQGLCGPRIDWGPMAGSEDNAHGADGGCAHADWIAAGGSIYHSGDRHVRMPRPVHARRTCNLVPGNIVLTPASLGEGAQGLRVHMQIKLCTVHRGGMHCKTSSGS